MPRYSVKTLIELSESELVSTPEFKFTEFERVDPSVHYADAHGPRRRRSSNHHHQRPAPPVAIIPNHILAASKEATPAASTVVEEEEEEASKEGTPDADDELAAHYFLRRGEMNHRQKDKSAHRAHGQPAVQLSYAAALAHTSTIGRHPLDTENDTAVGEEEEAADDGWISVSHDKPRRKSFSDRRSRGSFSRWRRDGPE